MSIYEELREQVRIQQEALGKRDTYIHKLKQALGQVHRYNNETAYNYLDCARFCEDEYPDRANELKAKAEGLFEANLNLKKFIYEIDDRVMSNWPE